ncbi:hypothetical protein [Peribacillus butanolivorans]|uniref:hypothetical protein n=1 Tax=Peribacillus butanolivorans TaxID=421767 RepID=UPI0036DF0E34
MLHLYLKKNKLLHRGVLTATPPSFSFIAVTTTHWRPFIPPAAATSAATSAATAASAIMAMSSLAAAFGKLLNFLHYFFKHIFHLFSSFLELTVLLL